MYGRRALYLIALSAAAAFHMAYGQYVSHYILLFVLLLPVVSLILSLPAMLSTQVKLMGADDVHRNRPSHIKVEATCAFFLPLDCLKLRVEQQNLFVSERPIRKTFKLMDLSKEEESLDFSTEQIGTIRCRIRSAWAYDYLGFFAIPIRKGNPVAFTVLPSPKSPEPEPNLIDPSEQIAKPKPQGFSEEHELRPYRAGDSINLIHWKLSSKFDDPIIREPQELIRKNIILAIDLPDSYSEQENLLDQLVYLSDQLLNKQIPFTLYIGMQTVIIRSDGELSAFLKTFLSEPMRAEKTLSIRTGNDTLVYRLTPNQKEAKA